MKTGVKRDKVVGLVLSGGGVKGMAHIGILKALNEHGIFPDIISGVSAGALVGALYGNGASTIDMLAFFRKTPLFKYNFLTLNKPGLFDTDKYIAFLETHFPVNNFGSLQRELHVVATNLHKGTSEYFSSGALYTPLLASAALPPVFSPVRINGCLYADGGIMNNFPVEPLEGKADVIIGSYTTAVKEIGATSMKNSYDITNRAKSLMLYANSMGKFKTVDLLFKPKGLEYIGVLDKKGIEKAYMIGYEYASKILEDDMAPFVRSLVG
jgi:NTE family protein